MARCIYIYKTLTTLIDGQLLVFLDDGALEEIGIGELAMRNTILQQVVFYHEDSAPVAAPILLASDVLSEPSRDNLLAAPASVVGAKETKKGKKKQAFNDQDDVQTADAETVSVPAPIVPAPTVTAILETNDVADGAEVLNINAYTYISHPPRY